MMAKEFLSRRGVDFRIIDVNELDDASGTLRAITGGPIATPVIVIGDEHRIGFDPDWMEARIEAGPETKAATGQTGQ